MKKLIVSALVTLVSLPLLAADESSSSRRGDDKANVQFELSLTDTNDVGETTDRSVEALALDGTRIRLMTGWRIPIPTTTFNSANTVGSDIVPVTSYQYQDVGVSASLESRVVRGDKIRVSGQIEVSAIQQGDADSSRANAPKVGTFSHEFDVILADGVETTLAEVPKPGGGSLSLALAASILD